MPWYVKKQKPRRVEKLSAENANELATACGGQLTTLPSGEITGIWFMDTEKNPIVVFLGHWVHFPTDSEKFFWSSADGLSRDSYEEVQGPDQ